MRVPGDIVFAGGAFTPTIVAAKLLAGTRRRAIGKAASPIAAE